MCIKVLLLWGFGCVNGFRFVMMGVNFKFRTFEY